MNNDPSVSFNHGLQNLAGWHADHGAIPLMIVSGSEVGRYVPWVSSRHMPWQSESKDMDMKSANQQ
jgi:hypothetical protein